MSDDRIVDLICVAISLVVLAAGMMLRPATSSCPPSWHNDGVRRSGHFECVPRPVGNPDEDGAAGFPETSVEPTRRLQGRIYCTGGAVPVVVDDRVVGCQRRF